MKYTREQLKRMAQQTLNAERSTFQFHSALDLYMRLAERFRTTVDHVREMIRTIAESKA